MHDLSKADSKFQIRIDRESEGTDRLYLVHQNAFGLYNLANNTVYVGGNRGD